MTFRRIALVIVAVAMLAIPAYAAAAKLPTYYRYGTKCTKIGCLIQAYTDSKSSKIVSLSVSPKCKTTGSSFTGSNNGAIVKINSKGKFETTFASNSYDKGSPQGTAGVMTVSGKVTKQDKIKGKWSVDKTSPGCDNLTSGKFEMKYKGKQQGG